MANYNFTVPAAGDSQNAPGVEHAALHAQEIACIADLNNRAFTGTRQGYQISTPASDAEANINQMAFEIRSLPPSGGPGGGDGIITFADNLGRKLYINSSGVISFSSTGVYADKVFLFNPLGGAITLGGATNTKHKFIISNAPRFQFTSDGMLDANVNQILTDQQPAIPDTTGANLVALEAQVNALKAMLRTHGLIAS